MPVTLKQLAQELGLHHSTVAYALSGKGTVKNATRTRVKQAATQFGYVPNGLARRMRSKKTNVIGLVIPDVLMAYNEFIQQIFRGSVAFGYDAQIALTEFDKELEDQAVRFLMETRVDGMIIKSRFASWEDVPEHHTLRQLVAQRVPTVCYGFPIDGSPFPCMQSPAVRQGEMLTEHLLGLGHRHLAWLMPVPALVRPHQQRVDGSRKAIKTAGLPESTLNVLTLAPEARLDSHGGDDVYPFYINETLPRIGLGLGRQLLRRAMQLTPRPTAILCLNEITAVGAVLEAQEMGLKIPGDVAIAASSRTVAAELAPISLTTAEASMVDAAKLTLDLLLETIAENDARKDQPLSRAGSGRAHPPRSVTLEPQLVIGRSTRRE